MAYTTIISTDRLANHLESNAWVIIDCRFDLVKPDWGFEEYQKAHIPGAVYASLDRDLSAPVTPQTGRHPLPEIGFLIQRLSTWGIDSSKQVVAYDSVSGAYAARLWWMLRWLGHTSVAVLDGGFPKWIQEKKPVREGIEQNQPAAFTGHPRQDWTVNAEEVERIRVDPGSILIDARSPFRFYGKQEPIDSVAGHIPGAINRFHGDNLSQQGIFLSAEELRRQYLALFAGKPAQSAVVYCGSGVTSCHHLLALEIAGLPGAKLYPGSWSEWIRDPQRATATGGS